MSNLQDWVKVRNAHGGTCERGFTALLPAGLQGTTGFTGFTGSTGLSGMLPC